MPPRPRASTPSAMVRSAVLLDYFNQMLSPADFRDYCPNGLQLEGRPKISRLVSGVTASAALIDAAIKHRAQALLVHHGYFWRGEDPCIVGMKRARLSKLLKAGINLYAYHLPLDAHPVLGNNVQLAQRMKWPVSGRGGDNGLIFYGDLDTPVSSRTLAARLARTLGQKPLLIDSGRGPLKRIAWCTGGAQDYIDAARELGADAFISGEVSERTTHIARETGISYFAAGHHATERFGVQALAEAAADKFGIWHQFIDDPNPV